MPLPQLSYERYKEISGRYSKEEFCASLCAAESHVRRIVGFNIPDESNEDAYLRALCAAVDVDVYYGGTGGVGEGASSVSLGKFSISNGTNGSTSSYEREMTAAIRRELVGSGLLYQGIG